MNAIKPLEQTQETVTLRRRNFEALLRAAEDAADLAAVQAHRDYEDRVGWETARRNYLTAEEARHLLNGESQTRVWREMRGMKQRDLAEAAEVAASYLAEIEAGKKPGSVGAIQRIASILDVLFNDLTASQPESGGLQPVIRSADAARQLTELAEQAGDRERLEEAAHAIVAEWRTIAKRDRVEHQVAAAVQALLFAVTDIATDRARRSIELERKSETGAARRMKRASNALEAAIVVLRREYRKG